MDLYVKYIKNTYNLIIKRQVVQLKMGKESDKTFPQESTQRANKHIKRCDIISH